MTTETRPPIPPFTREAAIQKIRMAEDGWNSRDPQRVSMVYTPDSQWRNRAEFPKGRAQIVEFLTRKWAKELDYRLIKELWAFTDNRIAVRFAYEWHDDAELKNGKTQWFRSYGNENWQFDANGLMELRYASINDLAITENERKFHWPLGRRPDEHASLSELGLWLFRLQLANPYVLLIPFWVPPNFNAKLIDWNIRFRSWRTRWLLLAFLVIITIQFAFHLK